MNLLENSKFLFKMDLCIPELLHRQKRDLSASGNPKKSKNITLRRIDKIKGKDSIREP
jgi:hypothetical protein